MTGRGATDGAIDAVIAAVAGPDRDAAALTEVLGRVSGARRELDQTEAVQAPRTSRIDHWRCSTNR